MKKLNTFYTDDYECISCGSGVLIETSIDEESFNKGFRQDGDEVSCSSSQCPEAGYLSFDPSEDIDYVDWLSENP